MDEESPKGSEHRLVDGATRTVRDPSWNEGSGNRDGEKIADAKGLWGQKVGPPGVEAGV